MVNLVPLDAADTSVQIGSEGPCSWELRSGGSPRVWTFRNSKDSIAAGWIKTIREEVLRKSARGSWLGNDGAADGGDRVSLVRTRKELFRQSQTYEEEGEAARRMLLDSDLEDASDEEGWCCESESDDEGRTPAPSKPKAKAKTTGPARAEPQPASPRRLGLGLLSTLSLFAQGLSLRESPAPAEATAAPRAAEAEAGEAEAGRGRALTHDEVADSLALAVARHLATREVMVRHFL